jgi:hypothetical protein
MRKSRSGGQVLGNTEFAWNTIADVTPMPHVMDKCVNKLGVRVRCKFKSQLRSINRCRGDDITDVRAG